MLRKSSAYKKAVAALAICLLVEMAGSALPVIGNTVFASSTTISTLQSTATNHPNPSSIEFPNSIKPGVANARVTKQGLELHNDVLSVNFEKAGNGFKMSSVKNKITQENYNIFMKNLFKLSLGNNLNISDDNMTIKKQPTLENLQANSSGIRLADRSAGKQIQTVFEYNENGLHFEVTWNVVLRDGSNSIKQEFTFKSIEGSLNITKADLIDLNVNKNDAQPVKVNNDSGSPINAKDIFMGLESPLAAVTVSENRATASIESKNPIAESGTRTYTTGIGVSPTGQMQRAFRYYLERERIHFRRPLLMYNSWWTFKMNDYDADHPRLRPGQTVQPTEQQLTEFIDMYGKELGSRGVTIDSYQIDDGWDNIKANPVWSFNKESLPNEFKNLKETAKSYGGELGVWMSPFGGYTGRGSRVNANPELNAQTMPDGSKYFRLSNPDYYRVFKDRVFNMIDEQGVSAFKFDGVGKGLRSQGPDDQTFGEYENLLKLLIEMREHKPDVFTYCTVGTWASPYWLWYCDSVWRDEDDQYLSGAGRQIKEEPVVENGEKTYLEDRERWVNYRDTAIYRHNVTENPFMTINELMTHGVTYSTHANYRFNNNLDLPYVRESLLNDMKMLFALGGSLEELHIQKDQVDALSEENRKMLWDNLAKNIKWAQENFALLSDNQWIGGDPSSEEVYGYRSWSREKGILTLRNPSNTEKTFVIDPQEVFNIPQDGAKTYVFTERDGVKHPFEATAGKPVAIKLKPFEVLVFEATPKDHAEASYNTNGDKIAVAPNKSVSRNAIEGITATSSHPNFPVENLLDNNRNSSWESNTPDNDDGTGQLPQAITVTFKQPTFARTFQYVPENEAPHVYGVVTKYKLETSVDGQNFTTVKTGDLENNNIIKNIDIDNPKAIKAIRFTALDSYNESLEEYGKVLSTKLATAAEINIFEGIEKSKTYPLVGEKEMAISSTPTLVEPTKPDVSTNQVASVGKNVERLGGSSRFDTAAVIADKMYKDKKISNVVIANAYAFADQITASTIANSKDAPVLLVDSQSPENNKAALEFIKAHMKSDIKVTLVGGTGVVTPEVEKSIKDLGVKDIARLAGADRYTSNIETAKSLNAKKGTPIIVASGEGFADSLSIMSIAGMKKMPILLIPKTGLTKEVKEYITSVAPSKITVIGGEGVISNSALEEIKGLSSDVTRLGGADRYETNFKVLEHFKVNSSKLAIASGVDYPDSMVGSIYASKELAPIMLVENGMDVEKQNSFIKSSQASNLIIFGGEGVVSKDLLNNLTK